MTQEFKTLYSTSVTFKKFLRAELFKIGLMSRSHRTVAVISSIWSVALCIGLAGDSKVRPGSRTTVNSKLGTSGVLNVCLSPSVMQSFQIHLGKLFKCIIQSCSCTNHSQRLGVAGFHRSLGCATYTTSCFYYSSQSTLGGFYQESLFQRN